MPYVNSWTFYSGFNATSDSQLLTDYAKNPRDYGEHGVAGFVEHRVQEQRWLYDEDHADYSASNKVREHEDWPYRAVRFRASMDYLDILPTDRVVLEDDDRNLPPVSWHNDTGPSDRVRALRRLKPCRSSGPIASWKSRASRGGVLTRTGRR